MNTSDLFSSVSGPTTASGTLLPAGAAPLDKTAFMDLLVQQLRNQDPLEPMANEEFVAQLATFSQLEQMENLNDTVVSMVLLQQSNALLQQLTDSSALIDRSVTYIDPVSFEEEVGVVDSVKIEDGIAQLSIGGKSVPLGNVVQINESTAADTSMDAPAPDTTSTDDSETN